MRTASNIHQHSLTDDVNLIRDYFVDKPVIRAYLFGSVIRGETTQDSDIDILIELDYSKKIGLQFVQMKLELEELLGKPVDLVSSEGVSEIIRSYIDKEKILVYARE